MAVRVSREIVLDASPDVIMDVIADVGAMVAWSPIHKRMDVIDTYPDGRPHHVMATVKVFGLVDKEVLEYRWGPDWVVWDAKKTFQQHGQHIEYNLIPEGVDKTRVRFNVTVAPSLPIPEFIIKRASELVLNSVTDALRKQVEAATGPGQSN